jgi:lysophospholipase L1-like esterase
MRKNSSILRAGLVSLADQTWVWAVIAVVAIVSGGRAGQQPMPGHPFERNVLAYEAADKTNPPPKGAILLVGDSQFFRWKTYAEDLSGYTVINRGIDSFQMSDLLYYTERLVLPYKPRLIVLHVGANDVHNGRSADAVLTDFKAFVAKVRGEYPGIPIAFSSTTPGPARWAEADKRKETNRAVKSCIEGQPGLFYIDLWDAMLTPDGKPRQDLWVADGIHSNHDGYLLRVKLMRSILGELDQKAK